MGYNGKRRPEEGHPCIGHRVQSERLCVARDQSFAVTDLVAKFSFLAWLSGNYSLRAGKLRLRQTDVPGAECALSHTKLG